MIALAPVLRLSVNENDMLLYAAIGSKSYALRWRLSQYYGNTRVEGSDWRAGAGLSWPSTDQDTVTSAWSYPVAPFGNGWLAVESCS